MQSLEDRLFSKVPEGKGDSGSGHFAVPSLEDRLFAKRPERKGDRGGDSVSNFSMQSLDEKLFSKRPERKGDRDSGTNFSTQNLEDRLFSKRPETRRSGGGDSVSHVSTHNRDVSKRGASALGDRSSNDELHSSTFGFSDTGERRVIDKSRLAFLFVLFASAAILAAVIFVVCRNGEIDVFERKVSRLLSMVWDDRSLPPLTTTVCFVVV